MRLQSAFSSRPSHNLLLLSLLNPTRRNLPRLHRANTLRNPNGSKYTNNEPRRSGVNELCCGQMTALLVFGRRSRLLEELMNRKHRTLTGQQQITSVQKLVSSRRLTPICRDVLTRHWEGRPPRRVWQLMRQIVFERDGRTCVYCGLRSSTLTCDHVIPVSRGGSSTFDNLVTACLACNLAKATMTPKEWRAQQRQRKRGE